MKSPDTDMATPLIDLSHVTVRWDSRPVLDNISLTVRRSDFIAITGPNGGGKTTMLRVVLKLLRPQSGSVSYLNPDGSLADRLAIGYLPQKNTIDSRFPILVEEVVASGLLTAKGMSAARKRDAVAHALEAVDMTAHARRPIGNLSGGQLQRTLLGRAIISKPDVLVLDEPLSYIDKRFEQRLYSLIADIAPRSTILLVSHEMTAIAAMANRHLIVDHTLHECTAAHHYFASECDDSAPLPPPPCRCDRHDHADHAGSRDESICTV